MKKRIKSSQVESNRSKRRDLTCRQYQIRANSFDEESRSVEAVIASEQRAIVFDMQKWRLTEEVLLMRGAVLPDRVPFLDSHQRDSVGRILGSTTDLRVEGDKIIAKNIFADTEEGERAFKLTRDGHLDSNSIGYRVERYVDIEPGKKKTIDGREFVAGNEMPLRITKKFTIVENSSVIVGADSTAKNRSNTGVISMDFEKYLEERGIDIDNITDAQRKVLEADYERSKAPQEPETTNEPEVETRQEVDHEALARAAHEKVQREINERNEAIRSLGNKHKIDKSIIEESIRSGDDITAATERFLAAVQNQRDTNVGSVNIHVPNHGMNERMLEAAMLLRSGYSGDKLVADSEYGDELTHKADKVRDMSLVDMARATLSLEGREIPLGRMDMLRSAFATQSLPKVLGNIANKSMLMGYEMIPQTWRGWCSTGSTSDFKTNTAVRATDEGDLQLLAEDGSIAMGSTKEEYEEYSVNTYAKKFNVSRKNIIDDDLGAFAEKPREMGKKANKKISDVLYEHFMGNPTMGDGNSLFDATKHANLNTSTALSSTGLSTSIIAFLKQTDADGSPISIAPKRLIVPPDLVNTATALIESQIVIATGVGSSAAITPNKNVYQGAMQIVTDPRLSTSTYSNYSTTTWYVSADPAEQDTVKVFFLNGVQTPTLERYALDPSVLGVGWRVYLDFGVKAMDWRSVQKNTA